MKKSIMLLSIVSIFLTPVAAQSNPMTLDDCIAYAVEHSLEIVRQQLSTDNTRQDLLNAAAQLLPSVSAGTYGYNTYGRNIDPETNAYTTTSYFYNNYSASASMPLFAGLSYVNSLRAACLANMAGGEELKLVCDQVALSVMQAYFDVVYYTRSADYSKQQLQVSSRILEQNRKYLELGTKSQADVAQIEVQAASDDYTLTEQINKRDEALLRLKQVMNWDLSTPLNLDTEVKIPVLSNNFDPASTVDFALANNPKARSAQLNSRNKQLVYSAAKGRQYPSVYLYSGYSTNYIKNRSADAVATTPFATQLKNNAGYYIQASVSIPIFDGLTRRTNINRARNNMLSAQRQADQTMNELQIEIVRTLQQMTGYGKQYEQATKKVSAANMAYTSAQQKFAQGTMSAVDLQTSANQLLQALSEQLNARLQYIVKYRMMLYYGGEKLY